MRKLSFLTGFGAGYVLGARAGRERYEQITSAARGVRANPTVQHTAEKVTSQASDLASSAKDKVVTKIDEHRHPDDATLDDPIVVDVSQSNPNGSQTGRMAF